MPCRVGLVRAEPDVQLGLVRVGPHRGGNMGMPQRDRGLVPDLHYSPWVEVNTRERDMSRTLHAAARALLTGGEKRTHLLTISST